jgi:hypothetical protein
VASVRGTHALRTRPLRARFQGSGGGANIYISGFPRYEWPSTDHGLVKGGRALMGRGPTGAGVTLGPQDMFLATASSLILSVFRELARKGEHPSHNFR